jgi:fumarate hydratase class I
MLDHACDFHHRVYIKDPEATKNDKFVALELLKNANVAANMVLPSCQDTGTAIILGKRGQYVLTDGKDEEHISHGVYDTYTGTNLR